MSLMKGQQRRRFMVLVMPIREAFRREVHREPTMIRRLLLGHAAILNAGQGGRIDRSGLIMAH